jgi:hypothetical protein
VRADEIVNMRPKEGVGSMALALGSQAINLRDEEDFGPQICVASNQIGELRVDRRAVKTTPVVVFEFQVLVSVHQRPTINDNVHGYQSKYSVPHLVPQVTWVGT